MVLGFGKGKIKIDLEKVDFTPGDSIKGRISLVLRKPIHARQLKVTLMGVKITTQQITTQKGAPSTKTKTSFIYRFKTSLDLEKEYFKEEYPFEIKIPADILETPSVSKGILGTLSKAAEIIQGVTEISSRIEWYIEVLLDIPKTFDVKEKVQINIG